MTDQEKKQYGDAFSVVWKLFREKEQLGFIASFLGALARNKPKNMTKEDADTYKDEFSKCWELFKKYVDKDSEDDWRIFIDEVDELGKQAYQKYDEPKAKCVRAMYATILAECENRSLSRGGIK